MLRSSSIANTTTCLTSPTTDSSSTRCSVLRTKIFLQVLEPLRFYPVSHPNRFTSYWFPTTFSSLVASPFSTPLPAVWRPGVPSLPVWRGSIPNRLLTDYVDTCRNPGFNSSFFQKPHCPHLLWLPLQVFCCCSLWRCKVSVLFTWQEGLSNNLRSSGFKCFKT